jgi:hypothetical protein
MSDRIRIIEKGKHCLLSLGILEMQCQIEITDEDLFLLAASAAQLAARRIRHKQYTNSEILNILRKALEEKP